MTENASRKLTSLLQKQGRAHGALRVAVIGGGCSGLQYKMDLVDGPANRDIMVESQNVRVVVDPKSALFVSGSRARFQRRSAKGRLQSHQPERGRALFLRRKLFGMTDYFALFGEARRPWLDPAELKEKYFAFSRTAAPSAELNEAFRVLSDPKLRLQHLLTLEGVELNAGRPGACGGGGAFLEHRLAAARDRALASAPSRRHELAC